MTVLPGFILAVGGNNFAVGFAEGLQGMATLIGAALILQGITDGIVQGPMVALMDDSVPAGKRSDVETANYTVYSATSGIGPVIGYLIFQIYGNNWTIDSMRVVIMTGVMLSQVVIIPQWLVDDKKTLGQQSEAVHLQE